MTLSLGSRLSVRFSKIYFTLSPTGRENLTSVFQTHKSDRYEAWLSLKFVVVSISLSYIRSTDKKSRIVIMKTYTGCRKNYIFYKQE